MKRLHSASKYPFQPKERLRGALGLVRSNIHTFEGRIEVNVARNSLGCQPPRLSLHHCVDSTGECFSTFLFAPQTVISLGATTVAASCLEFDVIQPRAR